MLLAIIHYCLSFLLTDFRTDDVMPIFIVWRQKKRVRRRKDATREHSGRDPTRFVGAPGAPEAPGASGRNLASHPRDEKRRRQEAARTGAYLK